MEDDEKLKQKQNDIENSLPIKEQQSLEKKPSDEMTSSDKIIKGSSSDIDEKMRLTGGENQPTQNRCSIFSCFSRNKSTKQIKSALFTSATLEKFQA